MTNIGEPIPRGVADVAHNFVGVPRQEVNLRHEYARLRKQVKLLRRRVEKLGVIPTKPRTARYAVGAIVALGVVGLVAGLMRNRRVF
ncbi:hypothetical protein ASE37_23415 [Rhizobium sp. Root268]|nr:hypothetical protein ASC86_22365 [Rhizobium sp. Root1212]KRD31696.1 hypothetical protein ASE37_23415 [Rhizobium sp. Root268]